MQLKSYANIFVVVLERTFHVCQLTFWLYSSPKSKKSPKDYHNEDYDCDGERIMLYNCSFVHSKGYLINVTFFHHYIFFDIPLYSMKRTNNIVDAMSC